jgi:hypothetical protein
VRCGIKTWHHIFIPAAVAAGNTSSMAAVLGSRTTWQLRYHQLNLDQVPDLDDTDHDDGSFNQD